jgi:hypothetical protein
MLRCVVHDICPQIRRAPCSNRCRNEHEQRADYDHDSRERFGLGAASLNRWRDQMPQRDDERYMVKSEKEKRDEINPTNDPKPFFKLELRRPHARSVVGGSAAKWFLRRRACVTAEYKKGGISALTPLEKLPQGKLNA